MDQLVDFIVNMPPEFAYAFIFLILLACGFGLPVPEDITLIAAGLYAYYNETNIFKMVAVTFLGVIIGDSSMFWLGKKYGTKILKKPFFSRFLTPERMANVSKVFHAKGKKTLFAARFMPGLRAPVFFSAGSLGLPYRSLLFYDGSAALISVPLIVYSVYHFGDELDQVVHWIKKVQSGIIILILSIALIAFFRWYLNKRKNPYKS